MKKRKLIQPLDLPGLAEAVAAHKNIGPALHAAERIVTQQTADAIEREAAVSAGAETEPSLEDRIGAAFHEVAAPTDVPRTRMCPDPALHGAQGEPPQTHEGIVWPKSWTADDIAWVKRQIIGEYRRTQGDPEITPQNILGDITEHESLKQLGGPDE